MFRWPPELQILSSLARKCHQESSGSIPRDPQWFSLAFTESSSQDVARLGEIFSFIVEATEFTRWCVMTH